MTDEPVKIRYHQGELGWALPHEDGTLTLDNLPFDGGLLNLQDVVRLQMPESRDELPFVRRVEARVFHAWSVIRYTPPTQSRYTALRKAVEASGGRTEGSFPGALVVASNVADQTELLSMLFLVAGDGTVVVVDHRALPPAPFDLPDIDPNFGAPAPTAGRPGPAIRP